MVEGPYFCITVDGVSWWLIRKTSFRCRQVWYNASITIFSRRGEYEVSTLWWDRITGEGLA